MLEVICAVVTLTAASTWSESGKAFYLRGESELINKQCTAAYGCSMHHMFFGGNWVGYDYTRLRVFVDNETNPSVDGRFYMIHGMGYLDDNGPWSAGGAFGKTGQPSGIFNNFVFPFTQSIRITATPYTTLNTTTATPERFWFIFRGQEFTDAASPQMIAGIPVLPPKRPNTKTPKLILIKNENITTPVFSNTTLFDISGEGGVYLVTISAESESLGFLEGQVRGKASTDNEKTVFSSGTEDYFLGTYYFNRGTYENPVSGLTHVNKTAPIKSFTAYRLHDIDKISFPDSYKLEWRCGEPGFGGTVHPCTSVFTYSWLYIMV